MSASAQDPVKRSPQYDKILLENDQVRVLEYQLKPGQKRTDAFASSRRRVCVEREHTFSYPDGRTEEKAAATGEAIWRDSVTHAVENTGKTEAPAIAIDLKTPRQH